VSALVRTAKGEIDVMHQSPQSHSTAKSLLVNSLSNAHALEKQAQAVMSQQVSQLADLPEFKAQLERHMQETDVQIERLVAALDRLGEKPSGFKDTSMQWLGSGQAFTQMMGPNKGLKAAVADQGVEGFEIASYTAIIALARAAEEEETAVAMEQSLAEERAMFDWLVSHMPEIATREVIAAAS
jgi:ferritin-like metal-binding protein YciE